MMEYLERFNTAIALSDRAPRAVPVLRHGLGKPLHTAHDTPPPFLYKDLHQFNQYSSSEEEEEEEEEEDEAYRVQLVSSNTPSLSSQKSSLKEPESIGSVEWREPKVKSLGLSVVQKRQIPSTSRSHIRNDSRTAIETKDYDVELERGIGMVRRKTMPAGNISAMTEWDQESIESAKYVDYEVETARGIGFAKPKHSGSLSGRSRASAKSASGLDSVDIVDYNTEKSLGISVVKQKEPEKRRSKSRNTGDSSFQLDVIDYEAPKTQGVVVKRPKRHTISQPIGKVRSRLTDSVFNVEVVDYAAEPYRGVSFNVAQSPPKRNSLTKNKSKESVDYVEYKAEASHGIAVSKTKKSKARKGKAHTVSGRVSLSRKGIPEPLGVVDYGAEKSQGITVQLGKKVIKHTKAKSVGDSTISNVDIVDYNAEPAHGVQVQLGRSVSQTSSTANQKNDAVSTVDIVDYKAEKSVGVTVNMGRSSQQAAQAQKSTDDSTVSFDIVDYGAEPIQGVPSSRKKKSKKNASDEKESKGNVGVVHYRLEKSHGVSGAKGRSRSERPNGPRSSITGTLASGRVVDFNAQKSQGIAVMMGTAVPRRKSLHCTSQSSLIKVAKKSPQFDLQKSQVYKTAPRIKSPTAKKVELVDPKVKTKSMDFQIFRKSEQSDIKDLSQIRQKKQVSHTENMKKKKKRRSKTQGRIRKRGRRKLQNTFKKSVEKKKDENLITPIAYLHINTRKSSSEEIPASLDANVDLDSPTGSISSLDLIDIDEAKIDRTAERRAAERKSKPYRARPRTLPRGFKSPPKLSRSHGAIPFNLRKDSLKTCSDTSSGNVRVVQYNVPSVETLKDQQDALRRDIGSGESESVKIQRAKKPRSKHRRSKSRNLDDCKSSVSVVQFGVEPMKGFTVSKTKKSSSDEPHKAVKDDQTNANIQVVDYDVQPARGVSVKRSETPRKTRSHLRSRSSSYIQHVDYKVDPDIGFGVGFAKSPSSGTKRSTSRRSSYKKALHSIQVVNYEIPSEKGFEVSHAPMPTNPKKSHRRSASSTSIEFVDYEVSKDIGVGITVAQPPASKPKRSMSRQNSLSSVDYVDYNVETKMGVEIVKPNNPSSPTKRSHSRANLSDTRDSFDVVDYSVEKSRGAAFMKKNRLNPNSKSSEARMSMSGPVGFADTVEYTVEKSRGASFMKKNTLNPRLRGAEARLNTSGPFSIDLVEYKIQPTQGVSIQRMPQQGGRRQRSKSTTAIERLNLRRKKSGIMRNSQLPIILGEAHEVWYRTVSRFDYDSDELKVCTNDLLEVIQTHDSWALVRVVRTNSLGWLPLVCLRKEEDMQDPLIPTEKIREALIQFMGRTLLLDDADEDVPVFLDDVERLIDEGRGLCGALSCLMYLDDNSLSYEDIDLLISDVRNTRQQWDHILSGCVTFLQTNNIKVMTSELDHIFMESTCSIPDGLAYLRRLVQRHEVIEDVKSLIPTFFQLHMISRARRLCDNRNIMETIQGVLTQALFVNHVDFNADCLDTMIKLGFSEEMLLRRIEEIAEDLLVLPRFNDLMGEVYIRETGSQPPNSIIIQ